MRKIMFSDRFGLTKAVLEGRKTMTRRIIPERILELEANGVPGTAKANAPYKVGEVVAVAQCLKDMGYNPRDTKTISGAIWGIDHEPAWTNKMFVSASLCVHQIRITNVRVERLQDISDEDCLREGILEDCPNVQYSFPTEIGYCGQYPFNTPGAAFAALIDKVSGKGTWESNPWVFVYEFELVK